jgi:hypothetical protein
MIKIAECARSVSFQVQTPRGVYWVTYTWRTAPLVPGEHWHCTCLEPDCEHITAVREHLTPGSRKEQAA